MPVQQCRAGALIWKTLMSLFWTLGVLLKVAPYSPCVCSNSHLIRIQIVDGHGGREVARFCSNWIPKEAAERGDRTDLRSTMVRLYNKYVEAFACYEAIP